MRKVEKEGKSLRWEKIPRPRIFSPSFASFSLNQIAIFDNLWTPNWLRQQGLESVGRQAAVFGTNLDEFEHIASKVSTKKKMESQLVIYGVKWTKLLHENSKVSTLGEIRELVVNFERSLGQMSFLCSTRCLSQMEAIDTCCKVASFSVLSTTYKQRKLEGEQSKQSKAKREEKKGREQRKEEKKY